MDTKDHPVIAVLGDHRRFIVPIYQRQYSWQEPRLQPFWEDVLAKAEEALLAPPKFNHYMGALILAPGADGYKIGATPRVQVVDGQQRLTTFMLFLTALRSVAAKQCPDLKVGINDYLFNPLKSGDTEKDAKYKLVPTPEDRKIFRLLMDGGLSAVQQKYPDFFFKNGKVIKNAAPNSVRAVAFFSDRITDYAKYGYLDESDEAEGSGDQEPLVEDAVEVQQDRVSALLAAVLNHMKVVIITLDEKDDAQVIFETLNSKNEPLLAMDLVRNNIFHRASAQGESAEELFESRWKPFDSPFWKEDSPRAKPRRPRIDHFLSHVLTAQTGQEISLRELYAEYRAFTRPKGKLRFDTVEHELDAILKYAPTFQALEQAVGPTDLVQIGQKLNEWDISTAYPLVFAIAASDVDANTKKHLYRLIYSYVVRRAICALTPKSLNKTFQRLVLAFQQNGTSLQSFKDAFTKQTGPAVVFPSDQDFRAAIKTNALYQIFNRKNRLADILWELELATRTRFSVDTKKPDALSIEHILPQTWPAHWPLMDGRKAPADKVKDADQAMLSDIAARDRALHTLGNLTLVTVPANTVASNSGFTDKASWLKQSLLALNLEVVAHGQWSESEIESRSKNLADRAVEVWPGLEAI